MATKISCNNTLCKNNYKEWCSKKKIQTSYIMIKGRDFCICLDFHPQEKEGPNA
jgi:hypothetical protein